MALGDAIRIARENAGLTQEELGKMCGTTKQTIYKYEIGKVTNIPLDRLEKIASALNVSSASLLGWEEKNPQVSEDERILNEELISRLISLTPEEMQKVDAFVQGLLANR